MEREPILVTQSSMPTLEEYIQEISTIFDTKWLTNNGVKHQQLELALKHFFGAPNVSLCVNGHLALSIALQSLDLPRDGEVITTPYSFSSTTHAIVQSGLKPVFCDIDPTTYTINADLIESHITPNTVAILPVHVYGHVCDVDKIASIAKKHNLKVIYDAAHVFGVKYHDQSIANYGDISMFSFHATKVFNTIEGGALTYHDENLKSKIEYLKNFGIDGPENVVSVGTNAKMNEFAAAMGLCNLRHFEEEVQKRKTVYERYIANLENIPGIKIPTSQNNVTANYAYFPIVVDPTVFGKNRDEIFEQLAKYNIHARKYFYPLITDYSCYKQFYDSNSTPIAKYVSANVLTLPMYANLQEADVDRICKIITS